MKQYWLVTSAFVALVGAANIGSANIGSANIGSETNIGSAANIGSARSADGGAIAAASTTASGTINQAAISDRGFPRRLSDYGFFDGGADRPSASLISYSLRNPLFSDYAEKQRYIHLPPGGRLEVGEDGRVQFPVGTALIKSFGYPDENNVLDVLETRVMLRRADGWLALPYVWNEDRSDAALKVAGTRIAVNFNDFSGENHTISYAVPNKNQCKQCHSRDGELAPIGPVWQDMVFSGDGDQERLARAGNFPAILPPQSAKWLDETAPINARAGSYLAANCAHCHSPTGSASNSGLFYDRPLERVAASGFLKRPVAAGRASGGYDFVVAPGDPSQSIAVHRMKSLDPGVAMPEIGRSTIHKEGVTLIEEWVEGLEP